VSLSVGTQVYIVVRVGSYQPNDRGYTGNDHMRLLGELR